ncbi:hypothetical protein D918_01057 [Trichuris suis]|nr:hypothetical protein D918_01057 [Trichuris suis]
MVKRRADGQLTPENWDLDEPSQESEVGEFRKAPEDVLARRKILVPRRRLPERRTEPEVNPFANFKGFKGLSFSGDSGTLGKLSSVNATTSANVKSAGCSERSTTDTVSANRTTSLATDILSSHAEKGKITSGLFSSATFEPTAKRSPFEKKDVPSLGKRSDMLSSHTKEQSGPRRENVLIEFVSKIKALNGDFVDHIQKCFQLNPFINFQPNFDDYIEHMKRLQQEHGITDDDNLWIKSEPLTKKVTVGRRPSAEAVGTSTPTRSRTAATFVPTMTSSVVKERVETVSAKRKHMDSTDLSQPAQSLSKFANVTSEKVRSEGGVDSQFKFSIPKKDSGHDDAKKDDVTLRDDGAKASSSIPTSMMSKTATSADQEAASSSKPLFNFGLAKAGGDSNVPFSRPLFSQSPFGVGVQQPPLFSGSLFPSVPAKAAQPIVTEAIPPEEGSIHDVRCKLYYMDANKKYNDYGIGQLYVKPLTSGRVQLVIRADNSIRNLLFNVAIDKSTPVTKAGKNGLSIVVVPNPPIGKISGDQPAVALLRVKTDVELTQLLDKIEEAKLKAEHQMTIFGGRSAV